MKLLIFLALAGSAVAVGFDNADNSDEETGEQFVPDVQVEPETQAEPDPQPEINALSGTVGTYDILEGGGGNDTLTGNSGDLDLLEGGSGDDELHLGASNTAIGGEGADRFFCTIQAAVKR